MAVTQVQKKSNGTGTGSATVTTTFDSTATAGNLLVAIYYDFESQGGAFTSTPSGWTAIPAVSFTHGDGTARIQWWFKIAAGGETGASVTVTSGALQGLAIFEYDPGDDLWPASPVDVTTTAESANVEDRPQLGPTSATEVADSVGFAGIAFDNNLGGTVTYDNDYSTSDGFGVFGQGGRGGVGIQILTATGAQTTTPSWDTNRHSVQGLVVFKTEAAPVEGEADLTGTGTLSASPILEATGAAALSGTGSLAASGERITEAAAALAGTGTLSASGVRIVEGAAALTGTGTLGAAGTLDLVGSASLTGTGTLTATGESTGDQPTRGGRFQRAYERDVARRRREEQEIVVLVAAFLAARKEVSV